MKEYELVGGPEAGRRLTVQPGVHEIVLPVVRPLEVFGRKVVPFRRGPEPSLDRAYYRRAGDVYRWEGLIDDAWCDMPVSAQIVADGGSSLRRVIRGLARKRLQSLAPDKELDRLVWRIQYEPMTMMYRVRARVGPRRVEFGLRDRAERRQMASGMAISG